jgi:invasion protein IalB
VGATAASPAEPGPPPAPPPVPTRTEILNFDNWAVTCNEFAEGPKPRICSAQLRIMQENTAQVVFSWTIAVDDSKQLVTIMQTPTGVAIAPGVELRVGKAAPHKIPFASCETGRCVATLAMDPVLLRELAAAPAAEAVIEGSRGNSVRFNIQMKGFDRAYAALSRP